MNGNFNTVSETDLENEIHGMEAEEAAAMLIGKGYRIIDMVMAKGHPPTFYCSGNSSDDRPIVVSA